MSSQSIQRNKNQVKAIKLILMLGLFACLIGMLEWQDVLNALSHLTISSIALLLSISAILLVISAAKWHLFLQKLGTSPGIFYLTQLYLLGYFINAFIPSMIGGDVVRSMYAGKFSSTTKAITATILERYTGFVAMLSLAIISMQISELVTLQMRLAVYALGFGLLIGSLCILFIPLTTLKKLLPIPEKIQLKIIALTEGIQILKNSLGTTLGAFALSFLFHCITVLNVYVAAQAVGWTTPPLSYCL